MNAIKRLRLLRFTTTRIAAELHMAVSTVCAVLGRLGLGRLSALEPPEPPNRYCRRHPGELIHIDVKKLGCSNVPGHRVTGRRPGHHANRTRVVANRAGWEAVCPPAPMPAYPRLGRLPSARQADIATPAGRSPRKA